MKPVLPPHTKQRPLPIRADHDGANHKEHHPKIRSGKPKFGLPFPLAQHDTSKPQGGDLRPVRFVPIIAHEPAQEEPSGKHSGDLDGSLIRNDPAANRKPEADHWDTHESAQRGKEVVAWGENFRGEPEACDAESAGDCDVEEADGSVAWERFLGDVGRVEAGAAQEEVRHSNAAVDVEVHFVMVRLL